MREYKESPRPHRVKNSPLGNTSYVSGSISAPTPQGQTLDALVIKARHMLFEDDYKKYVEKFFYKPIEVEYYVDKVIVKINFPQPLEYHNFLKFIGLNKNFNPKTVKFFYSQVKFIRKVLECHIFGIFFFHS